MRQQLLVSLVLASLFVGCSTDKPQSFTLPGPSIIEKNGWTSFALIEPQPIETPTPLAMTAMNFLPVNDGGFIALTLEKDRSSSWMYRLDQNGKKLADEPLNLKDPAKLFMNVYPKKVYPGEAAIYWYDSRNLYRNDQVITSLPNEGLVGSIDFDESKNVFFNSSIYYEAATNSWKDLSPLSFTGRVFIDNTNPNRLYSFRASGTEGIQKLEVLEADLSTKSMTHQTSVLVSLPKDEPSQKFVRETKDKLYMFYIRDTNHPLTQYVLRIFVYDKTSQKLNALGQDLRLPYNRATDKDGSIVQKLGKFLVTDDSRIFYAIPIRDQVESKKIFAIFELNAALKFIDISPTVTPGNYTNGGMVQMLGAWAYGHTLYVALRKICHCGGSYVTKSQIVRFE
jgi:hypothetical protein